MVVKMWIVVFSVIMPCSVLEASITSIFRVEISQVGMWVSYIGPMGTVKKQKRP
jgi:hypothetical protein